MSLPNRYSSILSHLSFFVKTFFAFFYYLSFITAFCFPFSLFFVQVAFFAFFARNTVPTIFSGKSEKNSFNSVYFFAVLGYNKEQEYIR